MRRNREKVDLMLGLARIPPVSLIFTANVATLLPTLSSPHLPIPHGCTIRASLPWLHAGSLGSHPYDFTADQAINTQSKQSLACMSCLRVMFSSYRALLEQTFLTHKHHGFPIPHTGFQWTPTAPNQPFSPHCPGNLFLPYSSSLAYCVPR